MSVWQLTLLTLAVVPLMAIAGGGYTIIMSTLSEKGEAAYAEASKIAEEVDQLHLPNFLPFLLCKGVIVYVHFWFVFFHYKHTYLSLAFS